MLAFELFL